MCDHRSFRKAEMFDPPRSAEELLKIAEEKKRAKQNDTPDP